MNIQNEIKELEKRLAALKKNIPPVMINIPNRNYSMSATPVTVHQYTVYCEDVGLELPAQPEHSVPNSPVVNVTMDEMIAYCDWLSEKRGTTIRLPTEDEWEYCCADHQEGNSEIACYDMAHIPKVQTKKPNKFGLYDMLGCVWEMTSSKFSPGQ